MLRRIVAFVLVAAALTAALLYSQFRTDPFKVSGFLESDEIRLGSRVGGRVARVHVDEGADVESGQLLVELEPFDLLDRLAQAEEEQKARQADVDRLTAGFRGEETAQARARLAQLRAVQEKLLAGPRKQEIAAAQAQLRLAQAQLERDDANFNRQQELLQRNTISREEFDRAATALRVSQETVRVREEELNLLLEGTRKEDLAEAAARVTEAEAALELFENGYRQEELAQARAALEAAHAAVRVIRAQVDELSIRAPLAGTIEAIELQPGDLVMASAPVISLADAGRLWVRAYVPENRLDVQLGQLVRVSLDSFPGRTFRGRVSFIARQAEFMPGNVQTPEERSKQVFRIKVEMLDGLGVLRPGMIADVWFDAARQESPR